MKAAIKHYALGAMMVAALMPWNAVATKSDSSLNSWFGKKLVGNQAENMIVQALIEVAQGKNKQALSTVNRLLDIAPNFKLAYLIRGDLLTAQAKPIELIGANSEGSEQVQGLRDEAKVRITHYLQQTEAPKFPRIINKLDENQSHIILVDTSKSRLFLYKKTDSGFAHQADYYITIGKNGFDKKQEGDKRTPLGVYFASKKLTQGLDDFYGIAAYPLDYPNALDLRQNKTGSGIWLHGTPSTTYSRPPRASDGCVVLSNPDLKALAPVLDQGNTPVIIADHFEWNAEENEANETNETDALLATIENWRKDWVSQNTNQYLGHYSNQFFYSDGNLAQWAEHKSRIQAAKPKVSIALNHISVIGLPSHPDLMVVNFEQDFRSSALNNRMLKRQYWAKENGTWKIIYEGAG